MKIKKCSVCMRQPKINLSPHRLALVLTVIYSATKVESFAADKVDPPTMCTPGAMGYGMCTQRQRFGRERERISLSDRDAVADPPGQTPCCNSTGGRSLSKIEKRDLGMRREPLRTWFVGHFTANMARPASSARVVFFGGGAGLASCVAWVGWCVWAVWYFPAWMVGPEPLTNTRPAQTVRGTLGLGQARAQGTGHLL